MTFSVAWSDATFGIGWWLDFGGESKDSNSIDPFEVLWNDDDRFSIEYQLVGLLAELLFCEEPLHLWESYDVSGELYNVNDKLELKESFSI